MNPPINVRICSNSGHNCRIGSRASNAETLATHLHNRWQGGQFEIIQPTEAYSYEHILLLLMLHHYGTDSTKSFDWLTMHHTVQLMASKTVNHKGSAIALAQKI